MNEVTEADASIRLRADGFSTGYDGIAALDIPRLELRGNVIALIGHNGAGKSTFIKGLLGLLPALEGSFEVCDRVSGCPLVPEDDMAFCPETGAVFSDISVKDYVRLWCRMKQGDGNYYKKAGAEYVELMQLEPLMSKLGRELSKGQRRRVQTAVGFLSRPKLFLFDEPFDGLGVQKTSELADIIRAHSKKMSFVISSHRMDVVERLADQVLVLKDGRLEAAGGVSDVCRKLSGKRDLQIPAPSLVDAMNIHLQQCL